VNSNRGLERGRELLRRHKQTGDQAYTFTVLDREWVAFPGVFSPVHTPATGLFTTWLPYPVGGTFLEMGSGVGVTAVWAALRGCRRVYALDINQRAVENTRANARRHGVSDRLTAVRSDLFDALPRSSTFDAIFWNSNFIETGADFQIDDPLLHAFFDPGYATHRRFLEAAPAYLNPGGRLFLGFSDVGNQVLLRQLCQERGMDSVLLQSRTQELHMRVQFQLLEIIKQIGSSASSVGDC
jgi:release factor glutamine methyltransferase